MYESKTCQSAHSRSFFCDGQYHCSLPLRDVNLTPFDTAYSYSVQLTKWSYVLALSLVSKTDDLEASQQFK